MDDQVDEKSEYSLWRIHLQAAIICMKLDAALSDMVDGADNLTNKDTQHRASKNIVTALSDSALRVVRTVIGQPKGMMTKLNYRYDWKSTAPKTAKMSKMVSIRYISLREDLSGHIDRMAGLLETLKAMRNPLHDSLAIEVLVASI